jgi:hypothetical protein
MKSIQIRISDNKNHRLPVVAFLMLISLAFVALPVAPFRAYGQTNFPSSLTKESNEFYAGYSVVAPSNSISYVTGSWIVPTVTCTSGETAEADYLVQLGSDGDNGGAGFGCLSGTAYYRAGYEFQAIFYAVPATDVMKPKDLMIIVVTDYSESISITVEDRTQGWSYEYLATDSSNEPFVATYTYSGGPFNTGYPNPNFGTLKTSNNELTISGSYMPIQSFVSNSSISVYQYAKFVNPNTGDTLATTSNLKGSDSAFNIVWKSLS